jgi:PAS domain S-box-containing protein
MGVRNKPQDYDNRDVETVWSLANLAWDIVLRKKAEERLELQGMVLDQASDHIAITDLQGVVTYVNQAQCQASQTQRNDMIGRHASNFIWAPPTGASQQQIIDATLKEGAWRGEVLYTTSDGRVILVDLRTTLIRSKDGKAIALCGMGNDITAHKIMEKSLRQSEDRFRRIFDESPIAKAIVSPDFRFLRVNEALCHITGYADEELLATDFAEITHSDDLTVYLQQARRLFAKAIDHYDMELRYFHKHGEEVWVHIWIKLIQNVDDNQMYLLHTLENITARKKADYELIQSQARLQAMYRDLQNAREKERRRIAREIHDEMGQNLTALKIDMAFLKKLMHPIQDQLNERFEAMEQLFDQTIENVRRISSDLRPGMLDSLGLAAAMEWYVKDFERRTEIQCEIQIDQGEVTVPHDIEIEVFRILQEALTNVARHANAESVLVTLKLTDCDLQLRVVDDGDGIQNEKVSAPTSFGLLGVGERVAAHNGEFKISSRIGEGTDLKVIIPIPVRGQET